MLRCGKTGTKVKGQNKEKTGKYVQENIKNRIKCKFLANVYVNTF